MSDEQSFLAEIQDDPDGENPYLIFADWLEDRGDHRADIVRLWFSAKQILPELAKDYGPVGSIFPPSVTSLTRYDTNLVRPLNRLIEEFGEKNGDGRKSAALLTCAIVVSACSTIVKNNLDPNHVTEELKRLAAKATSWIGRHAVQARSAEQVESVVGTATHEHQVLARMIVEMMRDVGAEGAIFISSEVDEPGVRVEMVEGKRFPIAGWSVDDQDMLDNCQIAISIDPLRLDQIESIESAASPTQPLLILCPNVDSADLEHFRRQHGQKKPSRVIACVNRSKHWHDSLIDIGLFTGASAINVGDATPNPIDFGTASLIRIFDELTIYGESAGDSLALDDHHTLLNKQRETSEDVEWIDIRIARLYARVAEIFVAAKTQDEANALHQRAMNGLSAGRRMVEYGGVPGGGCVYFQCGLYLKSVEPTSFQPEDIDNARALKVMIDALSKPFELVRSHLGHPMPEFPTGLPQSATYDFENRRFASPPNIARFSEIENSRQPMDAAKVAMDAIEMGTDVAVKILKQQTS